jgi:HAD superfamily hydrolase (TIGR01549 family)
MSNKKIIIYSDYPVEAKLKALELPSDKNYCSLRKEIGQLKPGRKALDLICSDFGCSAEKAVYFGDRDETDGAGARMAGITFIKVVTREARSGNFYKKLLNHFTGRNE